MLSNLFYRGVSALFAVWAVWMVITLYWVLSGHCCGLPGIAPWDDCLPAGDRVWFTFLKSGHCSEKTWKRVP